jgi:hypothetical protein
MGKNCTQNIPFGSSAAPGGLWMVIMEYMSKNLAYGLQNLRVNNKSFTKIKQNSNDNYNKRKNRI